MIKYIVGKCLAKGCSILVSSVSFEDGPKNPLRAHRWSSWFWLLTPSRGSLLGVKNTRAIRNGMRARPLCSWRLTRAKARRRKPAFGKSWVQCSLPWVVAANKPGGSLKPRPGFYWFALKPVTAKEARNWCGLLRKTPRLCTLWYGLMGIKVRP